MGKIAFAGPAIMEFGWEIMTWQSYLRKRSRDYDKMIISTFEGMEPLYTGFHCEVEFMPHKHPGRALDWRDTSMVELGFDIPEDVETIAPIKQFKTEGEFVIYGTPFETDVEVLFHARGIQKASFKNWSHAKWDTLVANFPKAASVGTAEDYHIPGTVDRRGIPLQDLMDTMASSQVIVGQSSGVMHLATLCGLRQVVWGDNKTHFSETLERRYKEIWNPFGTPVDWIETDAWNPEPNEVIQGMLDGTGGGRPSQKALNAIKAATTAGRYIIAIAYISGDDGDKHIESYCETVEFPNSELAGATAQIAKDMANLCDKAGIDGKAGKGNVWR